MSRKTEAREIGRAVNTPRFLVGKDAQVVIDGIHQAPGMLRKEMATAARRVAQEARALDLTDSTNLGKACGVVGDLHERLQTARLEEAVLHGRNERIDSILEGK